MNRLAFALSAAALALAAPPARADDAAPPAPSPAAPPGPVASEVAPAAERSAAYDGVAAPPTAAGNSGLAVTLKPGLEIIAQYTYRSMSDGAGGSQWFHLFDLPRAHASMQIEHKSVDARAVLEAVRSASEGSLMGVSGDSLVLRVREAWARARWPETATADDLVVEGKAGVVPTLTVPELEGTWMARAVGPTPLEATGFASPADLGGTVKLTLPSRFGHLALGAYNGEGYTNRELNRGKNLELAVSIHPLAMVDAARPLAVFGSYVMGSSGTALARANRATGALLWQGRKLRAGASYTYAQGIRDDGDQTGYVVDVFASVEPVSRLLVNARASVWARDSRQADADTITTLTGAVGYRVWQPLEGFVAFDRSLPSTRAQAALPGSDFWTLRVITRVAF